MIMPRNNYEEHSSVDQTVPILIKTYTPERDPHFFLGGGGGGQQSDVEKNCKVFWYSLVYMVEKSDPFSVSVCFIK